jgi:hypothetical protein
MAGPYTPDTFTAAALAVATMNNNVRDNMQAVLGIGTNQRPSAAATLSSFSVPNTSETAIQWAATSWNYQTMWTGGANTRLTVPASWSGKYLITFNATFAANATGYRYVKVFRTGVSVGLFGFPAASASIQTTVSGSVIATATGGSDYFELFAYQNSGGALNVDSNSFFQAVWLHA